MKDGFSTGGFSSVFDAPDWQAQATQDYLNSGAKRPTSGFSESGRGVPDIAAFGSNWAIRFGKGKWDFGDGTSTSAPFIASLVAKLNVARLESGRGTMGFMNPWLYAKAAGTGLFDVVEGHNFNSNFDQKPAFYATTGWDAATGLGTPNYGFLRLWRLRTGRLQLLFDG